MNMIINGVEFEIGPYANLQKADLRWADLRWADLRWANLQKANLQKANLRGADLLGANLRGANLQEANLQGADLRGADLRGADLRGADLRGANLRGADLRGADLRGAQFNYLTVGIQEAPQGELVGYKKVAGCIVLLKIPADSERSCATTRKHRCEYAEVICIESPDGRAIAEIYNGDRGMWYKSGEAVVPDSWDSDRWNECSHGIHFFLTEEEARAWV